MCQIFSGVVTRMGELYRSDYTDSHEDIVAIHGLSDGVMQHIVRVEYVPRDGNYADLDSYGLHVDEASPPEWFDDEMRMRVEAAFRNCVAHMIVKDDRDILVGGPWIIAGSARIYRSVNARIISVCDNASIESVCDSASIESVCDSASIEYVCDSASIKSVCGNASIKSVCDSASIKYVYGRSSIESVYGSASIKYVRDSASIKYVYGRSSIESVCDSASIGEDNRFDN